VPYRTPPKLRPLHYGPYTITKVVGDNAFELSIPPFLGLHPVFNVDLLRPYFPPLLDTSEVAEQLTPTELNPDCMEHETIDQIMDTQVKGTHQQNIQLYRVVKAGQLLHQGKWLTKHQVQQKFPHLMGELNKWRPFLPKGGGLIQVDIGGHPPIPLAQHTVSILAVFLQFFRVPNFWGHFEALNDIFLTCGNTQ
jgi:hypothetical protein